MKASKDILLRQVAGEHILIPVGAMAMKLHGMISLTESGLLLWQKLQEDCAEAELVDTILAEYDVDRETAARDVRGFLEKAGRAGLLEQWEADR